MFVKICGIARVEQGQAIARAFLERNFAGNCAIGFICAPQSKRFVSPERIQAIVQNLPPVVETIGVFVDEQSQRVVEIADRCRLSGIQLHGNESVDYCQTLRESRPQIELIKAVRLRQPTDLEHLQTYRGAIDRFLIDAYHPQQAGGTGLKADWSLLQGFRPPLPWLLAGGLTPDNVAEAIATLHPDGIDVSSGVEEQPGIKDLAKVEQLLGVLSTLAQPQIDLPSL